MRTRHRGERMTMARLRLEARRSATALIMWVALVGLGLYAAVFLVGQLKVPLPWQHEYTFRVAVADAKGVVPGSDPVRIAGVVVGKITGVDLQGSDPVEPVLTAQIDSKYAPIYKNAHAELRPNTPLDDMYLDIVSRGTPSAGRVAQGGELAADRTQTSVDIGEILDVFSADVRPRVQEAVTQAGIGLGNDGPQFREALAELAPFLSAARSLSSEIATRQTETRQLIHNLSLMTGELANRSHELNGLITDAGSTLTAVGDASGPLAQLIAELPPTLQKLVPTLGALRGAATQLIPALSALRPVAAALPTALAATTHFATDALPALRTLSPALAPLASLVHDTTPLADNLVTSFGALEPQLPELNVATAAIVPCESALAGYLREWNSVFAFSDDLGAFGREENDTGTLNGEGLPDPSLTENTTSCASGEPQG